MPGIASNWGTFPVLNTVGVVPGSIPGSRKGRTTGLLSSSPVSNRRVEPGSPWVGPRDVHPFPADRKDVATWNLDAFEHITRCKWTNAHGSVSIPRPDGGGGCAWIHTTARGRRRPGGERDEATWLQTEGAGDQRRWYPCTWIAPAGGSTRAHRSNARVRVCPRKRSQCKLPWSVHRGQNESGTHPGAWDQEGSQSVGKTRRYGHAGTHLSPLRRRRNLGVWRPQRDPLQIGIRSSGVGNQSRYVNASPTNAHGHAFSRRKDAKRGRTWIETNAPRTRSNP